MAVSVVGTSYLAPVGNVNATNTGPGFALTRPAALAVGDYYFIGIHASGLSGTNMSESLPEGWVRFFRSSSPGPDTMGYAVYGRSIETAQHLADVTQVPILVGASSTRLNVIGLAVRGVNLVGPVASIGNSINGTSGNLVVPRASVGDAFLTFTATSTSATSPGARTTHNPVGGTLVIQQTAFATATGTGGSSSDLTASLGAVTGMNFTDRPPLRSGAIQFGLVDAALIPTPDPDPAVAGNRWDVVAPEHIPTVSMQAMVTSSDPPFISDSAGWLREKRIGSSENVPGVAQTVTADLDLTNSSRFAYPAVVEAVPGHPANAGNYVYTGYKPGGAAQAARYLFNVSFVVTDSDQVELRLRTSSESVILGRIYVNDQPISPEATRITGAPVGGSVAVRLAFPTATRRKITIYGLNSSHGSFGGVAVKAGGSVTKPAAVPERKGAIIGDSFVNGSGNPPGGAGATETFAWDLLWRLGCDEIYQLGIGGTGWSKTIGDDPVSVIDGRVSTALAYDPEVLVIAAGRNDSATNTTTRGMIDSVLTRVASVPEVYVVPTATDAQNTLRGHMAAAVADSLSLNDRYIDVYQGAIQLGTDNVHPTLAGHQALAMQVFNTINGASPYPTPVPVTPAYVKVGNELVPATIVMAKDRNGLVRTGAINPIYVPQPHEISDLFDTSPFYIAHRGSGGNWPEHTMRAYSQSINHGMKAIEVSTVRASDGVFVCHHDLTTTRMTGTALTIADTPSTTLVGLTNTAGFTDNVTQPRQPITLLKDVLDRYAADHIIFIEAKFGGDTFALLNLMDTYPDSKKHFVWKQWSGSEAGLAEARARGYLTWGFFMASDVPNLEANGPKFSILGAAEAMTDEEISQVVAYGNANDKKVISWEVHNQETRDRLLALGVSGMMTSNILSVGTASIPSGAYTPPAT